MNAAAWKVIERAVSAEDASRGLYHFSMGAYENAAETEGLAFESEDFFACCFASLGSLLAYTDDAEAIAFFVALGVKF